MNDHGPGVLDSQDSASDHLWPMGRSFRVLHQNIDQKRNS